MENTITRPVKKIFDNFAMTLLTCDIAVVVITFILTKYTAHDHFGEKSFFSIYSGLQIYLIAVTAIFCFVSNKISGNTNSGGLLFIAAFISFLATDEIFELHENGKMITTASGYLFSWEPGIFYGEIMILTTYLVLALISLWFLKKELKALPFFRLLITGGGMLFGISLAIDLTFWPYFSIIFEEGSKVLGFGLIELAFLYLYLAKTSSMTTQKTT